jgi:hypothetical protein
MRSGFTAIPGVGLLLGNGEAQVQFAAALHDLVDHLVDGVLILARPQRDARAHLFANAADEARGGRVGAVLWCVGEKAAQIAVVDVRIVDAIALPLGLVVFAQRLAQAPDRIDLVARGHARRQGADLGHQRVHVLELLERRPAVVTRPPRRVWGEPHGERLGEVLVGMALRVPGLEMGDEATAVRTRRVVLGILGGREPEELLAAPAMAEAVGGVDSVPDLVAQDAHAPLLAAAFDLEHLRELEPRQPRVRHVERDGDTGHAVGGVPVVRQPEERPKVADAARFELAVERADARHQLATANAQAEIADAQIEQLLVRPRLPFLGRHDARHSRPPGAARP